MDHSISIVRKKEKKRKTRYMSEREKANTLIRKKERKKDR